VELKGGGLIRLQSGATQKIKTGGAPNGLACDAAGRIYFCDAEENAIRRLDPATGKIETLASELDGLPLNKPNDLAFDANGNLIFTCPRDSRTEPTGYVCCLTPSGNVTIIASELYFPNGLAFTADGDELIIAETYRQRLWRGVWQSAEKQWHGKVWATGLDGAPGPDGMAFANDGTLYVAVYGSSSIMCVDAAGNVIRKISLVGKNPTNCAFDPSEKLGLVVSEAEQGKLWSLPMSTSGIPLNQS